MSLYTMARSMNQSIKNYKKQQAGRYLSPVRRLERFAVPANERLIAMTFDDGPMNMPPQPRLKPYEQAASLTQVLVDILAEHGGHGTFNIIGSTAENYPDRMGELGKATWSGIKHDHYPSFENDGLGGAASNPQLIRKMIEGGHQLSNHGYRHILFGPNAMIYGKREYLKNIQEVDADLGRLHDFMKYTYNYEMTMSRPPHYIDAMKDKLNAYDAYILKSYDYLAASFDGGGWLPTCGDFNEDVCRMTRLVEDAIAQDDKALNGQIIFQKDGYNMSMETPVAYALDAQMKRLAKNGYKVITVDALKAKYPFSDFNDPSKAFDIARDLDNKGYIMGYRNNAFKPDETLTIGEMFMMTVKKADCARALKAVLESSNMLQAYRKHPYYLGFYLYGEPEQLSDFNRVATKQDVERFFHDRHQCEVMIKKEKLKRWEYLEYLGEVLL